MAAGRLLMLCAISLAIIAGPQISTAASFDCSKAATKQERLICTDQQLSTADDELARIYRRTVEGLSDKEAMKRQQQNWIRTERNICRDAPSMLMAYRARIAALRNVAQNSIQEALREANERFTFQGKPFSPRMLGDLLTDLADSLPGPVAVDVQGGANRYYAEVTFPQPGIVRAICKEGQDNSIFQYEHLGRLGNGMHVLKTAVNYGGSGTFIDLLLVKFLVDSEYEDGGSVRARLIMMRTGAFALGDRYNGTVKVQSDRILIGPGGTGIRENAKTEVIVFK